MMGRPFIDLAFLKKSEVVNGRIKYNRIKTGALIDIKVSKELEEFVTFYSRHKNETHFLLPILGVEHKNDSKKQYNEYLSKRKTYNKHLEKVGKLLGIGEKLTSYVARHSFASIANEMGVPLSAIKEMLNHQRISTTESYLKGLKSSILDDYNEKIIKGN